MANVGHRLTDIQVPSPNAALLATMNGPGMKRFLKTLGDEAVALYRAKVAKRSGRLAASAEAHVMFGGHRKDRLVAEVTVGGPSVVNPKPYKGGPFFYGVLHEHGSPTKSAQFPAADDLVAVMRTMRR